MFAVVISRRQSISEAFFSNLNNINQCVTGFVSYEAATDWLKEKGYEKIEPTSTPCHPLYRAWQKKPSLSHHGFDALIVPAMEAA